MGKSNIKFKWIISLIRLRKINLRIKCLKFTKNNRWLRNDKRIIWYNWIRKYKSKKENWLNLKKYWLVSKWTCLKYRFIQHTLNKIFIRLVNNKLRLQINKF